MPFLKNLFDDVSDTVPEELFSVMLERPGFRLERIVSDGHSTPSGEWYDQEKDEWVVLMSGSAGLLFEGDTEVTVMGPGDYVVIPAHVKHRVEWTDKTRKTVWLALHCPAG
jgi:cupin 2 domain-containing protein